MTFRDQYTKEQLDRGEGMQFHPVDGCGLHLLHYHCAKSLFFIGIPDGGWSWDENETNYEYPKISDGRATVQKAIRIPIIGCMTHGRAWRSGQGKRERAAYVVRQAG